MSQTSSGGGRKVIRSFLLTATVQGQGCFDCLPREKIALEVPLAKQMILFTPFKVNKQPISVNGSARFIEL